MRRLRARTAVSAAVASAVLALSSIAAPTAGASRATVDRSRFCVPTSVILDDLQKPVLEVTATRDPVLALTLTRTAKAAPRSVGRSMKTLAGTYRALGKVATATDRAAVAYAKAAKFTAAQKAVVAYYSTHCITTPVSAPNVGPINGASLAACLADLDVIKLAETTYSTLNGGYGTMDQLVAAGFLRSPSAYHPAVDVGTPPGGYTVVGNQTCNDTPVAG
jgi:hypothetical protein